MNSKIINNLYELWIQVGRLNQKLIKTETYSAVSMEDSNWTNRVFNLNTNNETIKLLLQLSRIRQLPEIVTVTKPNKLSSKPNFEFLFGQRNMALDLKTIKTQPPRNKNIKCVVSRDDTINFTNVASKAFRDKVDCDVINKIVKNPDSIRLFMYQENNRTLGCGMIFFDSNNTAGLHIIDILPEGRGNGIGKASQKDY